MPALTQTHQQKQSIAFKQVLMATDFSDASRRALAYALAIARRYGSQLTVLHAIPPEPREQIPLETLPRELNRRRLDAEQQMQRLGVEVQLGDLNHQLLLEQGRIWDVLASVMQRENTDLLVLGTHGRGGLKKLALGSVAEEVLRLASCPVLTVGPNAQPVRSGVAEFRRILFATDFGTASTRAFPYALSLAQDGQGKLVLLHMGPPMPSPDLGPASLGPSAYAAEEFIQWQQTMRAKSERKLRDLLPPDAQLAAEPEFIAGMDFLPEGILNTAASHQIELIVMGANRTAAPRVVAHIPWALTHEVICHAECPVLTLSG
jgi:nucleotide-binding universal stress UspA family protein